jgi:CheY-like chemotaxis protein
MTTNQTGRVEADAVPSALLVPLENPTTNTEKKRILVVDDEASVTRLLKLNLEQTNQYVVRTANDANAALTAAATFRPHLILLDVLMPGMDGGELAGRFKADPELESVPIVFLTAIATKTDVRRAGGQIGGLPFLAKPVDLREVLACIKQHLGGE